MATCKQCGNEYSIWTARLGGICNNCLNAQNQGRADAHQQTQEEGEKHSKAEPEAVAQYTPESFDITQALTLRYQDAYTEAHAVVKIGKVIKALAIFLVVIILIGAFAMSSGRTNGAVIGIGLVLGCMVGIPTYVLGVLVAAQGQTQLATLDTAVNSSRHLSDDEVARILSKKFTS